MIRVQMIGIETFARHKMSRAEANRRSGESIGFLPQRPTQ